MEWILTIIEKHTGEDGIVDVDKVMKDIKSEFPKHAVPKEQYNDVSQQLKDVNKSLDELKEQTKDNPELQEQLEVIKAENERLKIESIAKDKLRAENVVNLKFALFELGELELDDKGEIKNFDDKFKVFKENNPDQVSTTEKPKAGNYKVVDNKLQDGDAPKGMTREKIMAIENALERQQAIMDNPDLFKY